MMVAPSPIQQWQPIDVSLELDVSNGVQRPSLPN
jgi:hypothetical protein